MSKPIIKSEIENSVQIDKTTANLNIFDTQLEKDWDIDCERLGRGVTETLLTVAVVCDGFRMQGFCTVK